VTPLKWMRSPINLKLTMSSMEHLSSMRVPKRTQRLISKTLKRAAVRSQRINSLYLEGIQRMATKCSKWEPRNRLLQRWQKSKLKMNHNLTQN